MKADTSGFRSGAGKFTVDVVMSGHGMREVDPKNNVQKKVVVLCMAGATDPACA